MNSIDLTLALSNVVLCGWRAIATLRAGRLIAIVWLLIAYFAVFFIPVALSDQVKFVQGFFAIPVTVDHAVVHQAMLFVVAFNGIFAASEMVMWRMLSARYKVRLHWRLSLPRAKWNALWAFFMIYWLVGGLWWFLQTRDANYRDYVEGASWGSVIFWASSPLIMLAAMTRRWVLGAVLCVPFLYFCVHLDVRSFALLSLVPMFVVGLHQMLDGRSLRSLGRGLLYGILAGAVLVAVSVYINRNKTGTITLPDSGMPFGVVQTMAMVDRMHRQVGFDGLILYGWNYIHPFLRLLGVPRPAITDTPTVIAQLLEGVPRDWPVLFHFPALIWTDAYISFGWGGLWLAALWAVILEAWEMVMRRNELLLALLLPFYCWHGYLLVRGATQVASVPISYALYFSLFPFLLMFGSRLFRARSTLVDSSPDAPIQPPRNLMS